MLRSDFEKKICNNYLFAYGNILDELKEAILSPNTKSLQTKLNTPKIFRFLSDLSNQFSKYYSKVHVLEVRLLEDF